VTGVRIETILNEVADFISNVAPAGEIVYVTMSQYWDDNTPNNSFTKDELQQLTLLVWSCFDAEQLFGPLNAGPTDLLGCTYSQIIGSYGSNRSMVILVMEPPILDQDKIWPFSGSGSPQFSGGWSNIDDFLQLIADQQSKSIQAKSNSLPFQLVLTLTPQDDTVYKILEEDLTQAIGILALEVLPIPLYGVALCVALELVATGLLIAGANPPYSSLQDLSSKLFSSAPTVSAVYQEYFFGTQYAVPSIIEMDFYEDHRMDTQTGRNVAQVVELSKAITRANLAREALSVEALSVMERP
jgi:hypothetical protein